DARGSFFAPAAGDRGKNLRRILNHAGLLVGSEEEDAEALMFEGEGGENFAGDAEIGVAEVRALGGLREREADAAEGFGSHGRIWLQDDTSGASGRKGGEIPTGERASLRSVLGCASRDRLLCRS